MTWFTTIRGTEVEVHAESWDGDPSVGIEYGPEEVWATRLDNGEQFELTDAETEQLTIEACQSAFDDVPDWRE